MPRSSGPWRRRPWRAIAPADRAGLLRGFASAVDAHIEELAGLEIAGAGHPVGQARWEPGQVRDVLNYYAAAPERACGKQIPVAGGLDVTFNEPIGVVGLIVPWNFPMPILSWGMAPALAAGNAVIAKPAEMTPLTAIRIAELALAAGIPEGVFQVLPGQGSVVGQRLVDHPAVRRSCSPGRRGRPGVMAGCARQVKRVTLELGGKSANIVFADADLERAAATAPQAAFDNAGQDCCSRSRTWSSARSREFMELLEPAVKAVTVGDPHRRGDRDGAADLGRPPGSRRVLRAGRRAGRVPRHRSRGPGYWYPPTVLAPVRLDDPAYTEEVFGPVATVTPFEDEAEAVALANDTPYGLSGSIWTSDVGRAIRVARAVDTGNLSVNSHSSVRYSTPFGGFKQSGLRRELGPDALDTFTEVKNVFIATEGWAAMERFQDRVAVVTGAGGGLGPASARRRRPRGRFGRRRHRRGGGRRPRRRPAARSSRPTWRRGRCPAPVRDRR